MKNSRILKIKATVNPQYKEPWANIPTKSIGEKRMDFELEHDLEPYVLQSAVRLGLQVAPKDRKTRLKDLSYHLGNLTNFIRKQNHASQEILSRSTISTQQSIDSLHSKVKPLPYSIYRFI